jgi:hypothetical protein
MSSTLLGVDISPFCKMILITLCEDWKKDEVLHHSFLKVCPRYVPLCLLLLYYPVQPLQAVG